MIKRNSSIPDILEFLNLPIDTVIISNKGFNKYKKHNGTCVYLEYSFTNQTKLFNVLVKKHNNDDVKYHNENGPAGMFFYNDFVEVWHHANDKIHRINKPARIRYNYDGLIIEEWYYINNKIHRINKPAIIKYNYYGLIIEEWYYINDKIHRINKPAIIKYNYDGLIIGEYYYLKGKRHNSVGSACRVYCKNRWYNRFYINGIEFSRDMFFERMGKMNDKKQ